MTQVIHSSELVQLYGQRCLPARCAGPVHARGPSGRWLVPGVGGLLPDVLQCTYSCTRVLSTYIAFTDELYSTDNLMSPYMTRLMPR